MNGFSFVIGFVFERVFELAGGERLEMERKRERERERDTFT